MTHKPRLHFSPEWLGAMSHRGRAWLGILPMLPATGTAPGPGFLCREMGSVGLELIRAVGKGRGQAHPHSPALPLKADQRPSTTGHLLVPWIQPHLNATLAIARGWAMAAPAHVGHRALDLGGPSWVLPGLLGQHHHGWRCFPNTHHAQPPSPPHSHHSRCPLHRPYTSPHRF